MKSIPAKVKGSRVWGMQGHPILSEIFAGLLAGRKPLM